MLEGGWDGSVSKMANAVDSTAAPRFVRLRVEQLHAMLEAGILVDGEPLELLDGLLVYKDRSAVGEDSMTIGKRHNLAVKLLAALDREVEPDHHMQTQGPIACFLPNDEPEPDGAICVGSRATIAIDSRPPPTPPSCSRWPMRRWRTTAPASWPSTRARAFLRT